MILKMMSDEDLFDDHAGKGCHIVDQVREVVFSRLQTGEPCLRVTYNSPNSGLLHEDFIIRGNAYLMNDSGKTVQTFSPMCYKSPK